MLVTGPDGKIVLVNELAEKMFGYTRDRLLGMSVEQLIPERFHARHTAQRHQFLCRPELRTSAGTKAVLPALRADGSEFPAEINLKPVDTGSVLLVAASIRDMTLRHREEEQLRALSIELERLVAARTDDLEQANRDFRATFERASVGIAHIGPDGRLLRVNETLCDIVGYGKDELLSLTFQDITHPDDIDADLALMHRVLAGEMSSYAIDKRFLHRSGEVVWSTLSVSLVRDSQGVPQYFISIVKSIDDRKRAEAELQKNKESLERAINATGLGMFDFYPQTGRAEWNTEMKRHFGLSANAATGYDVFVAGLHPDDRARIEKIVREVMRPGASGHYQTEYRTVGIEDGVERWIEARGRVYFDGKGMPVRFIGTTLDITAQKRVEEALRARERQLQLIVEANPIGVARGTIDGRVLEANAAYLRILGANSEDVAAGRLRWDVQTTAEHSMSDAKAIADAQAYGVSGLYEKELLRCDGTRVPVLITCAVIDQSRDLVAFVLDISERKRAEERIRQTSLHDPLTGLPNRGLLFECAARIFSGVRRAHKHTAVLYFDLDRFKPINDNYGHQVGDEVLKQVAKRLTETIRGADSVFRLGGDEFLILLSEIHDDAQAGDVARHLLWEISRAYYVHGLELTLSTSIGISVYPRDGQDLETLMSHADAALYRAKQVGRNGVQFYSEELAAKARQQSRIEEQLKSALSRSDFELHYQPVVDMHTAQLTGVEALLRWPNSHVGPDLFVPIAEATGQIARLGEWVICEACRQHKEWCERGLPPIPIAVNVSAVQFRHDDFAEQFASLLEDEEVGMGALQVELTETALMENLDRAIDVLRRLQEMGIKISLDDFGTGYSSLNYLSRLPINKIKVDKSFVQRIEHDSASRAITEAVIALGRTLKLEVIAEGIESESALSYLRSHGCSHAQGYHVCKPLSGEVFEEWYRAREGKACLPGAAVFVS
ncbi:hypothetical protein AYR66_19555 [Noviherbaspirillum denitrificans]|uniref:Diguanylate cyclase n=2 Tax=Noviherbaspirillum denitrificans TaxID=1968433 RepID=A0A254TNQ4_9BURK|nr:hypothetical protein AYR66_19555 [Noviherbaspirillum denitrificans]